MSIETVRQLLEYTRHRKVAASRGMPIEQARAVAALICKQAGEGANATSLIFNPGLPRWQGVDLSDDDAVATYKRRRKYSDKRRYLPLISALAGLGTGTMGLAAGVEPGGVLTPDKYNVGKGVAGGLASALVGGLGTYGIGRLINGVTDKYEDWDIDSERKTMKRLSGKKELA